MGQMIEKPETAVYMKEAMIGATETKISISFFFLEALFLSLTTVKITITKAVKAYT